MASGTSCYCCRTQECWVRDRSFVIKRPCEAEGLQSLFCAQTGFNLAGWCPQLPTPEVSCHDSSLPPPFLSPSVTPPHTRCPLPPPPHWVGTSFRRPGTGKPLPTPNRRPSSVPAR